MIKIGEFRTKAGHTHTVRGDSFELGRPYEGKIRLVVHDENGTYEQRVFGVCTSIYGGFLPLIHYSDKNNARVEVFVNESPDLWKYTFEVQVSKIEKLNP